MCQKKTILIMLTHTELNERYDIEMVGKDASNEHSDRLKDMYWNLSYSKPSVPKNAQYCHAQAASCGLPSSSGGCYGIAVFSLRTLLDADGL